MALVVGLAAAAFAPRALAGDGPPQDGLPVITAGREAEVAALLAPLALGREVAPHWVLSGVEIGTAIRCVLSGPGGAQRVLILTHPGRAPQATERTRSFALLRDPPGPAPAGGDPLDALAAAVRRNDRTDFWPAAPPSAVNAPLVSDWRRLAGDLPGDGILIMVAGLLFLLAHLRRQLRQDPPWVAAALLALVCVGAVLRALLPGSNLMEAWAYERLAPLAGRIYGGPVLAWVNAVAGGTLFLVDVLFAANYVLAIVTPLALYAHARYILGDHRQALAAAALLVILPEHLRFSRSDVYMIQSLATSSLTFVVLYTALIDTARGWRIAAFLLLPLLCTATYFVRPENIVFFALDVGAIYICARGRRIPWRAALAVAVVATTAALAAWFNLRARYSGSVEQGLTLQTLFNAVRILFNPRLNTLVNPWITPPVVTALAAIGAWSLWHVQRPRAVFLVTWLLGFFVVHSFVYPYHAAMQARYHMNLVTPFVLLAAAATPVVLAWRPLLRRALVATLALAPFVHRDFIGDTRFNEMREFVFLDTLRERIPAGCTVLEYSGLVGEGEGQRQFVSRVQRVASRLAGGEVGPQWEIVPAAEIAGDGLLTQADERLSAAAAGVMAHPPRCLVFYEGLTCFSLRRPGQDRTPICQAMHDRLDLDPIATTSFASRIYDPVNAGYLAYDDQRRSATRTMLPEGDPVSLTAYRVRGGLTAR